MLLPSPKKARRRTQETISLNSVSGKVMEWVILEVRMEKNRSSSGVVGMDSPKGNHV